MRLPESQSSSETQNQRNELLEFARLAGIDESYMPRPGTEIYRRVMELCMEYIAAIDAMDTGSYSNSKRRIAHNELCKAIFGKQRAELSPVDQDRVSDFAAGVAGRNELMGSF